MAEVIASSKYDVLATLYRVKEFIFDELREEYADLEVTASQSFIIHSLISYGKQNMSDIAKTLGLSNSTVSGIIDKMEKKDIVKRTRDIVDRRVVRVYFTESYYDRIKDRNLTADVVFDELLDDATEEQRVGVIKGIKILSDILKSKGK